jgi:hypothetical protein
VSYVFQRPKFRGLFRLFAEENELASVMFDGPFLMSAVPYVGPVWIMATLSHAAVTARHRHVAVDLAATLATTATQTTDRSKRQRLEYRSCLSIYINQTAASLPWWPQAWRGE